MFPKLLAKAILAKAILAKAILARAILAKAVLVNKDYEDSGQGGGQGGRSG